MAHSPWLTIATTGVCQRGCLCRRREKGAVLGHGVIDPRPHRYRGIHRGYQAQCHQRGTNPADTRPEQIHRGNRTHGNLRRGALLHGFERCGVDENQIQPHIEHRHNRRAHGQRRRQCPLRPEYFFGHVRGGIPAAIAYHHP